MHSLLGRDEVTFFIEASKILGRDMGILGGDYPAAMSVYVMAMRLAKNSDKPYSRLDVASEPRKSVYTMSKVVTLRRHYVKPAVRSVQ